VISWRYHLITIVAVFLALALGVLAGSTVIKQNLVSGLQAQKEDLTKELSKADAAASQAKDDASTLNSAFAALAPDYLAGRLAGDRVLIITPDNVDHASLSQAQTYLGYAGAELVATLTVNVHGLDTGALAAAVNMSVTTPTSQLAARAAHVLAPRLAEGAANEQNDVLRQILDSGLLVIPDNSKISKTTAVGGPDLRVVVIGPDATQSALPQADFIDPLVGDLVRLGISVAVAAPSQSATSFLPPLQQDPNSSQLATVNDAETPVGAIALVLGMERLARFDKGGQYGSGSGGSVVLATPSPATS